MIKFIIRIQINTPVYKINSCASNICSIFLFSFNSLQKATAECYCLYFQEQYLFPSSGLTWLTPFVIGCDLYFCIKHFKMQVSFPVLLSVVSAPRQKPLKNDSALFAIIVSSNFFFFLNKCSRF